MNLSPNNLYHIYNQGNNRQTIFFRDEDYLLFMNLYKKLITPYLETISWSLMPNHFHFMAYTDERCDVKIKQGAILITLISNGFRKLLSGYTQLINKQTQRSGSLFRQKTKSKCLSDIKILPEDSHAVQDYFVNCFHYIHQNPLVAGLVNRLEDWEFSSFRDYAGLRDDKICNRELATQFCGYQSVDFMAKSYELVDKKIIRLLK